MMHTANQVHDFPEPPRYQLGYWKTRGLAAPIRMLFSYANQPYDNVFFALKPVIKAGDSHSSRCERATTPSPSPIPPPGIVGVPPLQLQKTNLVQRPSGPVTIKKNTPRRIIHSARVGNAGRTNRSGAGKENVFHRGGEELVVTPRHIAPPTPRAKETVFERLSRQTTCAFRAGVTPRATPRPTDSLRQFSTQASTRCFTRTNSGPVSTRSAQFKRIPTAQRTPRTAAVEHLERAVAAATTRTTATQAAEENTTETPPLPIEEVHHPVEADVVVYDRSEWSATYDALMNDGRSAFPALPYIVTPEGDVIVHNGAVVRHLARSFNLYGVDERSRATFDEVFEQANEFRLELGKHMYSPKYATANRAFCNDCVKYFLSAFDLHLQQRSTAWFAGGTVTAVDFVVFDVVSVGAFLAESYWNVEELFPNLQVFLESVRRLPGLARYFESSVARLPMNNTSAHVGNREDNSY